VCTRDENGKNFDQHLLGKLAAAAETSAACQQEHLECCATTPALEIFNKRGD